MSDTIRVEGSAQAELRSATRWYEEQRPGLGAEFLREIQRTLDILQRHPVIGARVPYVDESVHVRRILVRRFPFNVVYRRRGNELQVIAFAHTSRNPGYWMKG